MKIQKGWNKKVLIEEKKDPLWKTVLGYIVWYYAFSFGVLLLFAAFRVVGFILSIFINFNSW